MIEHLLRKSECSRGALTAANFLLIFKILDEEDDEEDEQDSDRGCRRNPVAEVTVAIVARSRVSQ